MPTELVRRLDLDLLYPPFLEAWLETLAACQERSAHYWGIVGFRHPHEQAKLYFQGRTVNPKAPRVTNARPYQSFHQFGLATDNCRDANLVKVGLQPAWDSDGYVLLKEEGELRGLQVGVPSVPGGDPGHVQYPLAVTLGRTELDVCLELERVYKSVANGADPKASLKAVWARVDSLLGANKVV